MNNPFQNTAQWRQDRAGKITASNFAQAAGFGYGSRQQLWRRYFGVEDEFSGNIFSDWGRDHEQEAIRAYEGLHLRGAKVTLVGFCQHPDIQWLGASPDGIQSGTTVVEVKCPQRQYDGVPDHYMAQIQGQMEVTGIDVCDFVVWSEESMTVTSVKRCNEYWQWLLEHLCIFWAHVQAGCEPKRSKRTTPPDTKNLINSKRVYIISN